MLRFIRIFLQEFVCLQPFFPSRELLFNLVEICLRGGSNQRNICELCLQLTEEFLGVHRAACISSKCAVSSEPSLPSSCLSFECSEGCSIGRCCKGGRSKLRLKLVEKFLRIYHTTSICGECAVSCAPGFPGCQLRFELLYVLFISRSAFEFFCQVVAELLVIRRCVYRLGCIAHHDAISMLHESEIFRGEVSRNEDPT